MKKKITIIVVIVVLIVFGILCFIFKSKENTKTSENEIKNKTSSEVFKEKYESVNKQQANNENNKNEENIISTISNGTLKNVDIDSINPFYEISADELVKMIEENKSFYVFFGDEQCPWCRDVIEECIKVAKENNISRIYYVEVWKGDREEIFRDKYVLEDGNPKKLTEGTESYKKLLNYFDSYLEDYTLTDNDGNKVNVGEKRIYAPSFMYIQSGKIKRYTTGISKLQSNAYQELTEEILNDEEKIFKEFFKNEYCGDGNC